MITAFNCSPLAEAAREFTATLDARSRALAVHPFDYDNRLDWSFIPRKRQGLPLGLMSKSQKDAFFRLLDLCLSDSGATKVRTIIEFEGILGRIEGNPDFRDPGLYFVTVFGEPSSDSPWGWRLEGHHVSLNLTFDGRGGLSMTPAFWGANPANVPEGPEKGRRALSEEEDLGRAFMVNLDPAQKERALVSEVAYPEILSGTSPEAQVPDRAGIGYDDLSTEQRMDLRALVELYLDNLESGMASVARQRIGPPEKADLRFTWAGGLKPGQGHYYRISGSSFLIEYDNTQNGANHIHTVWRELHNDFGADLLP